MDIGVLEFAMKIVGTLMLIGVFVFVFYLLLWLKRHPEWRKTTSYEAAPKGDMWSVVKDRRTPGYSYTDELIDSAQGKLNQIHMDLDELQERIGELIRPLPPKVQVNSETLARSAGEALKSLYTQDAVREEFEEKVVNRILFGDSTDDKKMELQSSGTTFIAREAEERADAILGLFDSGTSIMTISGFTNASVKEIEHILIDAGREFTHLDYYERRKKND